MNKAELRKIYLDRRKNLSPEQRAEKSARIARRFFERFDWRGVRTLHGFLPIEKFGEINTLLIFERVWREHPHVATVAPRVDETAGKIENVRFDASSAFARGKFGIDEPFGGETIAPDKIDLVLTPLLCFDRRGFRVGYGKGFYDKFLRECRADCRKIGLSFFPPVAEIEDISAFDVALDACVTPENIDEFGA